MFDRRQWLSEFRGRLGKIPLQVLPLFEHRFDRRQLLSALVAGMSGLIGIVLAVPIVGYLLTPLLRRGGSSSWVSLGSVADFNGQNPLRADYRYISQLGYTPESVRGFAYVVPAMASEEMIVLSPVCTHMGCKVHWDADRQRFLCPCHGGQYLKDGLNVAGPPPRPLPQLPMRIENGLLMIQPNESS